MEHNSGAPGVFGGYGCMQPGQRTDFMKLFGQPVHREAVTHKHRPQAVYNSATVHLSPISAAESVQSITASGQSSMCWVEFLHQLNIKGASQ